MSRARTRVSRSPDSLDPYPPKYSGGKPPRCLVPPIGTVAASQLPRSCRGACWEAATVPPLFRMALLSSVPTNLLNPYYVVSVPVAQLVHHTFPTANAQEFHRQVLTF